MIAALLRNPRLLMVLAGLAVIIMIAALIWRDGYDTHQDKIEKETNDAASAANLAELDRRDCVAAGGLWDFAAALCRSDTPDDR